MTKTNDKTADPIFSNGRYNKEAPSSRPKITNEIFSKKTNSKVGLEEAAQKNSPYNNSPRLSKSVNSIKPSYPSKKRKSHFSKNSENYFFRLEKSRTNSPTTKICPNGGKFIRLCQRPIFEIHIKK